MFTVMGILAFVMLIGILNNLKHINKKLASLTPAKEKQPWWRQQPRTLWHK